MEPCRGAQCLQQALQAPIPSRPIPSHPAGCARQHAAHLPWLSSRAGAAKATRRPQRDSNPHLPHCGHREGGELPLQRTTSLLLFLHKYHFKKKRDGPHSVQPSAQKELRRSSHELGLRKRTKPPPSPQPSTDPCSTTLRALQAPRKNPGALGPRTGPGHGAGRGTRRRGDTAVGAADTPRAPVPARPRPPARHVPAAPSGRGSPRSPAPAQSADSAPAPAPGRGAAT